MEEYLDTKEDKRKRGSGISEGTGHEATER
jgi:hypothetical protein